MGCSTTYYCTDTTNECTPTTEYSSAVSITTEGTSYIRYYSTDTAVNAETTATQTIKVDTTNPITAYTTSRTNNTITNTLSCADLPAQAGASSSCSVTYYCYDTHSTGSGQAACTPTTTYTTPVEFTISQNTYFRYYSVDYVSNSNDTTSQTILLQGGSGSGGSSPVIPDPPDSGRETPGVDEETPGVEEATAPPRDDTEVGPLPAQIAQQIQNITKQIAKLFLPRPGVGGLQGLGPLAEAVPRQAPPVFQGWDIMEVIPVSELALTPVENNIAFFANRIPQFRQALLAFGIDLSSKIDAQKISGVELYLPGLTKTVLTETEILEIASSASPPRNDGVQVGELEVNQFALVQGGAIGSTYCRSFVKNSNRHCVCQNSWRVD